MISDCAIIDAEGCPVEIRDSGNEPWHFIGEVRTNTNWVNAICERCNRRDLSSLPETQPAPFQIIALLGYSFLTDDMIEVTVYWGRCDECRSVYWARSGPPFRRARSFVTTRG